MKKTITLLLIFTSSVFFSQVPSYVPTNGLVGWWPFTGNANDLSGNGNNGTNNGATLTTDRFGNTNSAYSFDGTTNEIAITNSFLMLNADFTISCWMNSIDISKISLLALTFSETMSFRLWSDTLIDGLPEASSPSIFESSD